MRTTIIRSKPTEAYEQINLDEFTREVNHMLASGGKLHGSPFVIPNDGNGVLCQMIITDGMAL